MITEASRMPSRSTAHARVATRAAQPKTIRSEPASTSNRVLRAIAGFEAFKGVVALAAGLGLLGLAHHDLRPALAALIGHVGLKPGGHYPAMLIAQADQWLSADLRPLWLALAGYVLLRLTEAYGLWTGRAWGERLGAMSGAIYVPFELQHLLHKPRLATAGVLAANLAVVAFLAWGLWRRKAASAT